MKLFILLLTITFFYLATASTIEKREDDNLDCPQLSYDIQSFVKHYEKGLRQFAKKKATKDTTQNEVRAMSNASKVANTLTSILHAFQTTCQPTARSHHKAMEEMETLYRGIHLACQSLEAYNVGMNHYFPMMRKENAQLNGATHAITNRCLNPYAPRFY